MENDIKHHSRVQKYDVNLLGIHDPCASIHEHPVYKIRTAIDPLKSRTRERHPFL